MPRCMANFPYRDFPYQLLPEVEFLGCLLSLWNFIHYHENLARGWAPLKGVLSRETGLNSRGIRGAAETPRPPGFRVPAADGAGVRHAGAAHWGGERLRSERPTRLLSWAFRAVSRRDAGRCTLLLVFAKGCCAPKRRLMKGCSRTHF